ncbi:MAG TPA: glycoside hydrolase family 127 protein [Verrucomicrobiae bacterium]|nr:glycoside hydrolase family 127 protein [Verrucomicrobiae bacterium]
MSTGKKIAAISAGLVCCAVGLFAEPAKDYPLQPVPFTAVHLTDEFWAPRIETNRVTTIPYAFQKCEDTGRMDNFLRAAKALRGETLTNTNPPGYPFDDTDVYKVLEGASYALAVQPDPKMREYLDSIIAEIGAAQEPDGYLYTARTINPKHPHPWSGPVRWLRDPELSHELYDAGHLFEAAAAHYQATGETNLLHIALKEADLLCRTFGPATNQLHLWPGHEVVEMGLVKLYRITGEPRYLALAKYFIDVRGPGGDDYHQSRIKPVDQTNAIGHAVRAGYLYSGMADVAALTGDASYVNAIDRIWQNAVGDKLYITGGIGAVPNGEAFGPDYFLPNSTAYCETCAAVANDFWNERLFLLHGEAKYADVMERTLYNGLLSGVSLDGKLFFYPNPLASAGQNSRSPWFGCACCPGNITRFMASVPGYFYARQGKSIYVNLFASGVAEIKLDNGPFVKLTQETHYPWDGAVRIQVSPDKSSKFALRVRVPGWARDEAVPGGLYTFIDKETEQPSLQVNGRPVALKTDDGYAVIERRWKKGDTVLLTLPMPVRRVAAREEVVADRGRVALQRGPLVYCLEWPDNPGVHVPDVVLPDNEELTAQFEPDLLNGVETIKGRRVTAIPYYAWANRGKGDMEVWIRDSGQSQSKN